MSFAVTQKHFSPNMSMAHQFGVRVDVFNF